MEFRKVLNKLDSKDIIYLGRKEDELLSVDIREYPSIIITGETGTGKSILLDQIICQLIKTHTSLEMGLVLVDTTGVELNKYADSRYAYFSALGDDRKALVCIAKVIREMFRRRELLESERVINIHDYNEKASSKLPLLILAIDDNNSMLQDNDTRRMFKSLINEIHGLGILFILVENDVNNKFFTCDDNEDSSIQITYDYVDHDQSDKINIPNAENLNIGKFLAKIDGIIEEYEDFKFDDSIIDEIVEN